MAERVDEMREVGEVEEFDVVASVRGVVSPCADRGGTIPSRRFRVSALSMSASSAGTASHGSEMGKLSRDKEDVPSSGARIVMMGAS